MLNLRQIVDMASKRVPNTETDQTCVDFLNALQNRLYRKFSFPEQIEQLLTVANQSLYTLPSYIKPDRIKNLVLTNSDGTSPQEYEYATLDDDLVSNTFFKIETELSIMVSLYPAPALTGQLIIITFEDGPNTLDSSNMTTAPRFFYDYHMIFVYALASELAKIRKDIVLANNYANDYEELLNDALINLSDQDPIHVKIQW